MRAAFELCSETMAIQERIASVYSDTLKSKILLSRIYSAFGEYDKASETVDFVLENDDARKYRAEYSDACYAAAENYRNMKQYEKAKKYAEKSLEFRRSIYEEDYIDIREAQKLCEELKKMPK